MEFEDLLKDVGGYGRYQKFLAVVFLIPAYILMPWFCEDLFFMTHTPDHWCYVPEVAHSNLSLDVQKNLVRPPQDSRCSTYDVNYSNVLHSGNLTVDTDWPTRQCGEGWQYDKTDYDTTVVTKWNLVCQYAHYNSLVLSIMFVGNIFGTPFFGFMSDRVGRKPVLFSVALLVAVSETCSMLSPYFSPFLILRAFQGSCLSSLYSYAYVIPLELVSPEARIWINGVSTMAWSVGLCLLPLIAWLTRDWVRLSMVAASCAAGFCLYWKLLPESPRWLISEKRYDEAHAILVSISKTNGKDAHKGNQLMHNIEKLGEKIKNQRSGEEKHSPLDFFRYPTLRKRFLLIMICWISCMNIYYGVQVNVKNLAGSEFLNFFLVSVIEVPAHLAAWVFMDRIGRRWCNVFSFIVSGVFCLVPVLFPPDFSLVAVIASLFAKAGSCSSWMVLYQQAPEIYPTTVRCLGMAMTSTVGIGSALIMPYIVYLGNFGTYIPFLIFSIISFLAAICASFLPETLNKNLPQTIADAERFEKDFKFWSWAGTKNTMPSPKELNICTTSQFLAADSQATTGQKHAVKNVPALENRQRF